MEKVFFKGAFFYLVRDRSWKDIAKKLPSYALSNEIGMESQNIYLVDLSTKNAYHTANDYLQHYYPNDFNPIDYFYNGEKIIIELNDDENRYYLSSGRLCSRRAIVQQILTKI